MTLADVIPFGDGCGPVDDMTPDEEHFADEDLRYALLRALHPTGYRDLRAIVNGKPVQTRSCGVEDLAAVDEFAALHHDRNIYVGVAPRIDDTHRDKGACLALYALFVDQDFKDYSSEAEARARLAAFPLPPSAVVYSGGGLQSHWLLSEPLDIEKAKPLLRALATALGGDMAAAEPARVLRLPGTLNYKYDPPRAVIVETLSVSRRYAVAELQASLPDGEASSSSSSKTTAPPIAPTIPHGQQYRALFTEGCRLRRMGWDEPEIAAALWALHKNRSEGPNVQHEEDDTKKIANSICDRYPKGTDDFVRDKKKVIIAKNQENIHRAVKLLGVELSFNEFSAQRLFNGEPLEDRHWQPLLLKIDREYHFTPPTQWFKMVIEDLAWTNSFHPVKQYLDTLTWDRQKRCDEWVIKAADAEDNQYVRAVSSIFLIAAVRRIRQPGAKYDELMILENAEQGTNKSSALQALCPNPAWFSDDLRLNLHSQQLIEATLGKWIVEASDLAGRRKTEIEQLKAMLSRQVDGPARLAYAHFPVERPRHFVIAGTTNSSEYLCDPSGNRRFWPIAVQRFDINWIKKHRDQLWAEASVREAAGESIRLPERLWPVATEEQEKRHEIDPWEAALKAAVDGVDADSTGRRRIETDDLWKALGIAALKDRDRVGQLRIAGVMQRLGFVNGTMYVSKKKVRAYVERNASSLPIKTEENE